MTDKRLLEALELLTAAVSELTVERERARHVVNALSPNEPSSTDRAVAAVVGVKELLNAVRADIEAAEAPWVAAINSRG